MIVREIGEVIGKDCGGLAVAELGFRRAPGIFGMLDTGSDFAAFQRIIVGLVMPNVIVLRQSGASKKAETNCCG